LSAKADRTPEFFDRGHTPAPGGKTQGADMAKFSTMVRSGMN